MLSHVILNQRSRVVAVGFAGVALIALLLGADPSTAAKYYP